MDTQKKLFLLDAYALIYRAYFGFIRNPMVNSKGLNTSAIIGFVNTLEDILKNENPSHIAVCFDPPGPTFRHEAFDQYKAQREATPEDIKKAIPYIKQILEGYKIPIIEVNHYEADDVIGTLAKKAKAKGFVTYMMTPDKDYGQLIEEHIYQYKPRYGGNEYDILDEKKICEKFEITSPLQVIDILGLMGDSSDNIPGCPGVGEVTAKKLIKEFSSIENLLEHTEQLKGALLQKITTNKEMILFSKFLATIKTDVPVEFDEQSLEKKDPDTKTLQSIFQELEFRNLLKRYGGNSAAQQEGSLTMGKTSGQNGHRQLSLFDQPEESSSKPISSPSENKKNTSDLPEEEKNSTLERLNPDKIEYKLCNSQALIIEMVEELKKSQKIAIDTETSDIDPMQAQLVGISFSNKKNRAWYLPYPSDKEQIDFLKTQLPLVLENESILKIGQNLKYDWEVLHRHGFYLKGQKCDTMIAHYLIEPELRHSMDYMAEIYLGYETIKIETLIGPRGKGQKKMSDLTAQEIYLYAAEDADITFQLWEKLEPVLRKEGFIELFEKIEMPLMEVLAQMEMAGVRIDAQVLAQTSEVMNKQLVVLESEIQQMAGTTFNVNSPKQVGEILFDHLKINDKAKKTKTGQYVTSEEALQQMSTKHPIISKILEQRGVKKLLGTYIDALPQLIHPITGKIHTHFNQTVTATGRLSSSNPNLQNIPIRDNIGKEIRKAFIPDQGSLFFSADYSQIELRLMAHLSQDPSMIEAFRSAEDIHAATAAKIYKKPIDQVTKQERSKAKTANFGIIYGISVFGLSERLNIPRAEAKELIDGYFETYPKVKEYMDLSIQKAKEQGYVETLFKRKRVLSDINSKNAVVRGYAERNAINAPIQGTAADIIKIAMVNISKRLEQEKLQTQMILQVHDELNFNVPLEEAEKVQQIVINEMEKAVELTIPLIAECGIGANWLEAH